MNTISLIARIQSIADIASARNPKTFKPKINPFKMPDDQFKARYRFNKSTVRKIISMVQPEIELDRRGRGTSFDLQVLVSLRYWGRREVQDDSADLHGLSQSTVSRICARVARALARWGDIKIKMPSSQTEEERIMKEFESIQNFPGVIGVVGGTHIVLKKINREAAQYYRNRKGTYSMSVQVVCDAKLKIRDIVVNWTGSIPDSRIFNESAIKQRFENGEFRGRLLGDSGYKLQTYLFPPLSEPQNDKENKYNSALISTRNTVKRCFGVWKQRFHYLLDGLTVNSENAKTLIVALAVLHNIAIEENDAVPDDYNIEGLSEDVELERNDTLNIQTISDDWNIEEQSEDSEIERNAEDSGAEMFLKTFIQTHF